MRYFLFCLVCPPAIVLLPFVLVAHARRTAHNTSALVKHQRLQELRYLEAQRQSRPLKKLSWFTRMW
jgi:hypothetical protein